MIASQRHLMTPASRSVRPSVCGDWSNKLNGPINLGGSSGIGRADCTSSCKRMSQGCGGSSTSCKRRRNKTIKEEIRCERVDVKDEEPCQFV
ncbi:MAG: hypothetical protein ACRD8W_26150 [Nitrososphaeraceae archaeon]